MKRFTALLVQAGVLAATLLVAAPGWADSCREWRTEHRALKGRVAGLYLGAASQREVDSVLFDLLQHEAYLTACRTPLRVAREELIGWRLVGRDPRLFGAAVLESLLEQAGFDVALHGLLRDELGDAAGSLAAAPASTGP